MIQNVYIYRLKHGDLCLFGNNMDRCIPYIETAVNSVEDVCIYCSRHNLLVYYKVNHLLSGFIECFRVRRLTSKYSVTGSKNTFLSFITVSENKDPAKE